MKNMKIKIESPEHLHKVVDSLVDLGYHDHYGMKEEGVEYFILCEAGVIYSGNVGDGTEAGLHRSAVSQHWLHSDGQFRDYEEFGEPPAVAAEIFRVQDLFKYVKDSGNRVLVYSNGPHVSFQIGDSFVVRHGKKELADIITSFYNKKSKRDKLVDEMLEYANKVEQLKNQIEEMDNEV